MTDALAWLAPRPVDGVGSSGPTDIRALRYDGVLARVPGGGHAAVDLLTAPQGRATAVRELLPVGAALARATAAWVHTGRLRPERVEVVVAAHCRPHTAVVVHRQALPADDVVRVGGVAVTTPLRTAVDLLCFAEEDTAVAATRVLLRHGLVPELLEEVLSRPVRRLPTRRALRLLGRVDPDRCRA